MHLFQILHWLILWYIYIVCHKIFVRHQIKMWWCWTCYYYAWHSFSSRNIVFPYDLGKFSCCWYWLAWLPLSSGAPEVTPGSWWHIFWTLKLAVVNSPWVLSIDRIKLPKMKSNLFAQHQWCHIGQTWRKEQHKLCLLLRETRKEKKWFMHGKGSTSILKPIMGTQTIWAELTY